MDALPRLVKIDGSYADFAAFRISPGTTDGLLNGWVEQHDFAVVRKFPIRLIVQVRKNLVQVRRP